MGLPVHSHTWSITCMGPNPWFPRDMLLGSTRLATSTGATQEGAGNHTGQPWSWHQMPLSQDMRCTKWMPQAASNGAWRLGSLGKNSGLQANNQLHSTLRELRVIRHGVQPLAVQCFSDSQAGVALLRAMKGDAECLQEIRLIYQVAVQMDVDF